MKTLDVFNAPFKGFSLVEASAGTGKTFNITSLYIRAIIEQNYVPSNILVLTYTEAATSELKFRLRKRIKESIGCLNGSFDQNDTFLQELKKRSNQDSIKLLKNALFSFDEAAVFTIHGFCQKLLREESLSFGVQTDFEIIQDTTELIQDSVDAYWRKVVKEYSDTKMGQGLLGFLIDEKITTDTLKSITEKIIAKPYANLLPDNELSTKVEAKKKRVKELNEHLAYQWEEDSQRLHQTIFSGNLYKNSYKPDTFKEIWKVLENWVLSSKIHFKGFDKLENFGREKIEKSTLKDKEVEVPVFCDLVDEFLSEITDLDIIKADFILKSIEQISENITEQKEKKNALSFDDLLQKVESNLDEDLTKKIAKQYPLALVDEFQDTDPIQYSIFNQIYKNKEAAMFMIGDPKQAIYSFRGADLFTYFEATEDVLEEHQYSLNNNYRSNKKLISAVNSIYSRHSKPFVFDQPLFREVQFPENGNSKRLFRSGKEEHPLSIFDCNIDNANKDVSKDAVCEYVATQIKRLLNGDYTIEEKEVESKDISVLVRTKTEANLIQNTLQKHGIKSIARSNESVFKTLECSELKLILKAVIDHSNSDLIRAALITSFIGFNSVDVLDLLENESKWGEIVQVFSAAEEQWNKYGVSPGLNVLEEFFGIRERLSTLPSAERRITNLDHVQEILIEYEIKHRVAPSALIRFINQKINSSSLPSDEELIRLESDSDLVTINTLHSSKGLEYPIVFIPFLWDNFEKKNNKSYSILEYHDTSNILQIDVAPKNNVEGRESAQSELLADALRLSYVALTRAEAACFIPFVAHKEITNSSLLAMISGADALLNGKKNQDAKLDEFYSYLTELDTKGGISFLRSSEIQETSSAKSSESTQKELFDSINYALKEFERHDLHEFSRIVSFSSLTSSKEMNETVKDYDQLEFSSSSKNDINELVDELTKYTFPKGSITGNLLHNIFEHLDFQHPETQDEIIKAQFDSSGLDGKWLPVLNEWIKQSLTHELTDHIQLSKLSSSNVLKEMEFHFPVKDINIEQILKIIRNSSSKVADRASISGFMKGFIDLIFQHEGKYYILDYKSNHLGIESEDYNQEALKDKIISSNFDVQYHIYSLALKLYLEQRLPNFEFEKHFGGVFYFFLRGMEESEIGSGVFFDKPGSAVLNNLEKELGVQIVG
tara:strand:- start:5917 stop:9438 length:3522 start_codon:yes stop_codon:yes gene_type:complete